MKPRWILLLTLSLATLPALADDGSGDPSRGYDFLVNSSYTGCGLPYDYLKRLKVLAELVPGPLKDAFERIFRSPLIGDSVFGDPGIPGRVGLNSDVFAGLTVS